MKSTAKSREPDPAQALDNPRHEEFAQLQAAGTTAGEAYQTVYGTKRLSSAQSHSARLRARATVLARIQHLQTEAARAKVMDLREILEFLTRVKRTPICQLGPDSDLLRRCVFRPHSRNVWMLDKRACVELAAKLQGFFRRRTINDQPSPGNFPILTEERRALLIAAKRRSVERQLGIPPRMEHVPPASPANPSLPLPNPRHEAFARLHAAGGSVNQAYAAVYRSKPDSTTANAYKLPAKAEVMARVGYLRSEAVKTTAAVMDLREILEFLTRVMRTPLGELGLNSDLVQGMTIHRNVLEIRMPKKLPCVKLAARLQGFFRTPPDLPDSVHPLSRQGPQHRSGVGTVGA